MLDKYEWAKLQVQYIKIFYSKQQLLLQFDFHMKNEGWRMEDKECDINKLSSATIRFIEWSLKRSIYKLAVDRTLGVLAIWWQKGEWDYSICYAFIFSWMTFITLGYCTSSHQLASLVWKLLNSLLFAVPPDAVNVKIASSFKCFYSQIVFIHLYKIITSSVMNDEGSSPTHTQQE